MSDERNVEENRVNVSLKSCQENFICVFVLRFVFFRTFVPSNPVKGGQGEYILR